MSTISLRLPDSIHHAAKEWSEKDGYSLNSFISSAVAEKLASLQTEEIFRSRIERASRDKFDAVLAQVPDREDLFDK